MILRLRAQILEYSLLPIPLHVIPVVNHPMANGIVNPITWGLRVGKCLVSDEEIEVLNASFRREMTRTCRDGRASSIGLCSGSSSSDGSWKDAAVV